jgi:hypothetical protein
VHRLFLTVIAIAFVTAAFADESETKPVAPVTLRLYDLRAIQAAPGKLDALHARLRDYQSRNNRRLVSPLLSQPANQWLGESV